MIKITDESEKMALRIALSINRTKRVDIAPGRISASCRDATVVIAQGHNIPAGQYVCKDFFLDPVGRSPSPASAPDATHLGQVPSAPAWQMQMAIAELTGHVLSTRYLRALSIVYKGRPVTVSGDPTHMYLTLENITLTVALPVHTTKVLVSGVPVGRHQALKELARKQGTSMNKLILAAIKNIT